MIQTDNASGNDYDRQVGTNVRAAIVAAGFSVNEAAKRSGIAYATLDRKLKGHTSFTVAELRRLAVTSGWRVSDFLPGVAA